MEDRIIDYILNNDKSEYNNIIQKDKNVETFLSLSELRKNILAWYPFKKESKILEINGNYGEITELLCEKTNKVFCTEKNKQLHKCIEKRCDSNSLRILEDISELNEKDFDYIVIINGDDIEKINYINKIKPLLNNTGIVLIAFDNKCGFENLQNNNFNKLLNSSIEISQLFKENGFCYQKKYNALFDYRITNIMFDDSYSITREDVERSFSYKSGNFEYDTFMKNLCVTNNNDDIKKYCNSFLFEVSTKDILSNYKSIYFNSYRQKEYQIITKLGEDVVEKIDLFNNKSYHYKNYIENIKNFSINNANILDYISDGTIKSKYIKNVKRYDEELAELGSFEEFKMKFDEYINLLYLNSCDFDLCSVNKKLIRYNKELLKRFKYLKNAYIDMIPKNCFKIDGKLNFFDQEWCLDFYPVEFIIYRAILNSTNICDKFGKERLLKEYGLKEYILVFENMEKNFSIEVRDQYVLNDIFYNTSRYIDNSSFEAKIESQNEIIENLSYKNEMLKCIADDRENQLKIIAKSLSWRLTKPLRYTSALFRKLKIQKGINSIKISNLSKYKNLTDKETFNYWKKLYKKINRFNRLFVPFDEYQAWIIKNQVSEKELRKQRKAKFNINPKISIIIPLYNTPVDFFRELLYSVQLQTYSNWELCLADGSDKELSEIKKMTLRDDRIKYKFIGKNKGISGNTNEALKMATGDYIALLDHDDLLTLDSLYEVVKVINENPNLKFIYTDEDKISEIGKPRYSPHFKPDYSPDFFRCNNYICHFSFFRKDVMEKLGGFRDKYNGAQDFDIILRMTEIVEKENIKHIPKILYHWRVHQNSTASQPEAKPYAYYAGRNAVQDNIDRLGLKGKADIEKEMLGVYRVDYELINKPKITIIISDVENKKDLNDCLDSIIDNTEYDNYEILVINNKRIDLSNLQYYYFCNIIQNDENKSFNEILNETVGQLDSKYTILLDSKIIVKDKVWIEKLLKFEQRDDVGITGLKILDINNNIKHAGVFCGVNGFIGYPCKGQNSSRIWYCGRERTVGNFNIITDECMMFKNEVFNSLNGFNPELGNAAYIDFCLKLRKNNYLNVYEPHAELISKAEEYKIITREEKNKVLKMWEDIFKEVN